MINQQLNLHVVENSDYWLVLSLYVFQMELSGGQPQT